MSLHVLGILAVGLLMAASFVQPGSPETDHHLGTRFGLFLAGIAVAAVWLVWALPRALA